MIADSVGNNDGTVDIVGNDDVGRVRDGHCCNMFIIDRNIGRSS